MGRGILSRSWKSTIMITLNERRSHFVRCVCVCVYVCVYVCVCVCVCVCAFVCANSSNRVHMFIMWVAIPGPQYDWIYTYTSTYICVCTSRVCFRCVVHSLSMFPWYQLHKGMFCSNYYVLHIWPTSAAASFERFRSALDVSVRIQLVHVSLMLTAHGHVRFYL